MATHPTILLGFPLQPPGNGNACGRPTKFQPHVPPFQKPVITSIELVGFPMADPIEPSISSGCSLLFPAL